MQNCTETHKKIKFSNEMCKHRISIILAEILHDMLVSEVEQMRGLLEGSEKKMVFEGHLDHPSVRSC